MKEPNLLKKNDKINGQRKYLVIAILMVVILFASSSYALLTNFDKTENVVSIKTGNLSMTFNDAKLELTGEIPKSDEEGLKNNPITIVFTNPEKVTKDNQEYQNITIGKYDVKIVSQEGKISTLDFSYIKYAICIKKTANYCSDINNYDIKGSLGPNENDKTIFTGVDLEPEKSNEISLKIWIDESAGNDALGKEFYGAISVDLYQKGEFNKNKIIEYITNTQNQKVQFDTNIDFADANGTTNGNGLFLHNDSASNINPVYYFRGNVDNNNLLFANICWKIVRTTEGGGTKLIYNGLYDPSTKCNNTGTATSIGQSNFNAKTDSVETSSISEKSLASFGYSYPSKITTKDGTKRDPYEWIENALPQSGAIYGSSVTYANGFYTLTGTSNTLDNTHHYTCNETTASATCAEVRFYYFANKNDKNYYIELTGGDKIDDAVNSMTNSPVDAPSNVQKVINSWYNGNILNDYDNYVEDTTWCMERTKRNLNGWHENGNLQSNYQTSDYNSTKLDCSNSNSRLSYQNGSGNIGSKAALLSLPEARLAGIRNYDATTHSNNYLYTAYRYWLLSPLGININQSSAVAVIQSMGTRDSLVVNDNSYVRPTLSLNSNVEIQSGDGTATNPFVVTPYVSS